MSEAIKPTPGALQGGWIWVPVEPSTAMLVAGNHGQPGDFSALMVWQDMLNALRRSSDYTRPADPPTAAKTLAVDEAFDCARAALFHCPDRASIAHIMGVLRGRVDSTIADAGLVEQRDALVERVKELEEALQELMKWQVKNVKVWHNSAYDHASRVLYKSLPNTVAEVK